MTETKSRLQMTEVERLTADLTEARAEALRLRTYIETVVIPEFADQLDFVKVEVPSAVGTPPHIRKLIREAKRQLAVPYVES